mmetsp:Transcript_127718/g.272343  ORF Transcript_127718/g.272343 Transcript_127718/m.272343 type:complete len:231 (-) Transcript_127718:3294-3986(-)
MHARAECEVAALQDGAECHFGRGSEVADGADVARDVLREAYNALGSAIPTLPGAELPQGTRQEHHLLEVSSLVGVDALCKGAAHEGNGMVLVVTLAITQNWVAGEFHTESWLPHATAQLLTGCIHKTTEITASLLWVHLVNVGTLPLILAIDVGYLERFGELGEHAISVHQLRDIEELVHLHRHQASEAVAGVPNVGLAQCTALITLHLVVRLQCRMIEAHPCHSAPERL